ncbi:MAG: hypothetical protein MUO85_03495, partial [candidate division Zixibacteria bacterium]|nr:hypothetical protein [candidate division Zixibacteria bacterium]
MLSIIIMLFGRRALSNLHVDMDKHAERATISFMYDRMKVRIHVDRDFQGKDRNRTIIIKYNNRTIVFDYQNCVVMVKDVAGNSLDKNLQKFQKSLLDIAKGSTALEREYKDFFEAVDYRRFLVNNARNTLWISEMIDRLNALVADNLSTTFSVKEEDFPLELGEKFIRCLQISEENVLEILSSTVSPQTKRVLIIPYLVQRSFPSNRSGILSLLYQITFLRNLTAKHRELVCLELKDQTKSKEL